MKSRLLAAVKWFLWPQLVGSLVWSNICFSCSSAICVCTRVCVCFFPSNFAFNSFDANYERFFIQHVYLSSKPKGGRYGRADRWEKRYTIFWFASVFFLLSIFNFHCVVGKWVKKFQPFKNFVIPILVDVYWCTYWSYVRCGKQNLPHVQTLVDK